MKKHFLFAVVMLVLAAMVMSCASSGDSKASTGKTVQVDSSKPIQLKATKAKLKSGGGEGIRMEDGGNVGYWGNLNDVVQWELVIPADGEYVVSVQYSVAVSFAGAVVEVKIGDQTLPDWTVASTLTWGSYKNVDLGTVSLKAGTYPVTMQAKSIADRFVANVKYLALTKK